MKRKLLFGALTVVVVLAGVLLAYGATTFSQTITWTYTDPVPSFTVANPLTVDYGSLLGSTTKTETYTVTNNGNVPITVNAAASPTGATATWDKTSAPLAVGASTTFTLTLVISGSGSCTVNFAKA